MRTLLFSIAHARVVDHHRSRGRSPQLVEYVPDEDLRTTASAEDDLLASGPGSRGVPATVTLGGHPHEWYLLTEGTVIDLDALPAGQAVGAAVDRLLRMGRGEQVELRSGAGLDPVWREIGDLCPGGYQLTVLQDGPAQWRMQVTRRQAAI